MLFYAHVSSRQLGLHSVISGLQCSDEHLGCIQRDEAIKTAESPGVIVIEECLHVLH